MEGLDAIALDLPGFGATPPPDRAWGLNEYAGAVRPVLEEMSRPVVLLGHSFGGSVAVRLAESCGPEFVRALVVTGTPLIRTPGKGAPPLSFRLARWLHRRGVFPDSKMEQMRNARGSADYRAAAGVMRDTFVKVVNEDVSAELARLQVPLHLVWGEGDSEVSVGVAVDAAARVAEGHLTRLPGVGHDTPAEAPTALREALERLAVPHGVEGGGS